MSSRFIALAEAVADGQDLDWSSVDASGFDAFDRARLEELRAIADIGRCLATFTTGYSVDPLPGTAGADARPGALTTWGGLTIREHVGRGRFGDVYRAWDPAIDRNVALKLLRRPATDQHSEQTVVEEARLMGRVRHPNVATIYGAARLDGQTGLWMEFVEGRTLEAELRDRGPFDVAEAAAIGIELCRALGAVHAAGLLHRDVKAQNVMREVTGRVVLGDFGTGLEIDEEVADTQLAGTPVYLAPELWEHRPLTPQSDLYSLGVLLFHLVTGSFPVRGRSIAEIRRAHRTGSHTAITEIRKDLPPAFVEIVQRTLRADPADRFADAREMERALAAWLGTSAAESPRRSSPEERRRRGLLMLGAGAAATVLMGVALAVTPLGERIRRPARGDPPPAGAAIPGVSSSSRQLNRVPAPDAQFWGQPAPDARSFSFVDLNGDLGIFDTASGEQRILTNRERAGGSALHTSTFSPDGLWIAYGWETAEGGHELRIIAAAGGDPRTIWHSRDEAAHPIDWSSGFDRILAVFEQRTGRQRLGVIEATGSPVSIVAAVESGFGSARLSPDGRLVVFDDLQAPNGTARDIFMEPVDRSGERVRVVTGESDDFGPLWIQENVLLFISDRTGEPSVWTVTVRDDAAGEPAILHRNLGRVTPNGLSRDGTLYYTLQVGLVDVYEASFDPARDPAVELARPLVAAQVGSKANADWSRDGLRLAYVALPHAGTGAPNSRRLAIVDLARRATRVLNPPLSYYNIPQWSPDGRTILLKGVDLASRRGIFLVDVETGAARAAALVDDRKPQEIGAVQWGANSRRILFTRQGVGLVEVDLSIGVERLVFDFASEGITAITSIPGFRLSHDGRTIAYSAYRKDGVGKNETVLRVRSPAGPGRDLVVGPVRFEDWTAEGDVLFTRWVEGQGQMMSLWSVPAAGGSPVPLGFQLPGLRNVSVHPDGRRIAFTAGFPGSEVWALSNFLPQRERAQ